MNKKVTIEKAKAIMGNNFIGLDELSQIKWLKTDDILCIPEIPFTD